jgi:ABC-type phosphate/phosphonate transport system substrate-binding protein
MTIRITSAILCASLISFSALTAVPGQQPKSLHLALAKSFAVDKADTIINIAADDFKKVLKETTGFDGDLTTKLSAFEIADKLDKKQIDLGIFYAHEFAWVQAKHADLQPLIVAVNKQHEQRVSLIVHKNSAAKSIADLRGKKLDLPKGANELCRLFVAKLCMDSDKKAPAEFFGAIEKSPSPVEALDGVAREKAQAVVVDANWLAFYKENKGPTFKNQLRILQASEPFPPVVVVCKKGALDQKTLDQFTSGLLKADKTADGRDLMKEWNINAFERVPNNYAASLAELLKRYPPPESKR